MIESSTFYFQGRQKKGTPNAAVSRVINYLSMTQEAVAPVTEWQFYWPYREWAFDIAWPHYGGGLALEVEGGAFTGGRHTRGVGFTEDCVKYAAAASAGWLVLRIPAQLAKPDYSHADWNKVGTIIDAGLWQCYQRSGIDPLLWGSHRAGVCGYEPVFYGKPERFAKNG